MLQYDALEQLSRDRTQQRRREADAERLALQARGQRQSSRRRSALWAGLELLRARGQAARYGSGA